MKQKLLNHSIIVLLIAIPTYLMGHAESECAENQPKSLTLDMWRHLDGAYHNEIGFGMSADNAKYSSGRVLFDMFRDDICENEYNRLYPTLHRAKITKNLEFTVCQTYAKIKNKFLRVYVTIYVKQIKLRRISDSTKLYSSYEDCIQGLSVSL